MEELHQVPNEGNKINLYPNSQLQPEEQEQSEVLNKQKGRLHINNFKTETDSLKEGREMRR